MSEGRVGVVVFTRDLRLHDHRALAAAVANHEVVVPLFVFDEGILATSFNSANRTGFLLECLADLADSLRALGTELVLRRGEWVQEVLSVATEAGATCIYVSDDVSAYATRRLGALDHEAASMRLGVERHHGVTVVAPGSLSPANGDHYQVFTPYYRQWQTVRWRPVLEPPKQLSPHGIESIPMLSLADLSEGVRSPGVQPGGEREGRRRLAAWSTSTLAAYGDHHDDLAGDRTSHLSSYFHFGCLSANEVASALADLPGAEPFVRQLCWRDFCHQILAARPETSWSDFRNRGDRWRRNDEDLAAWKEGRTGYPIVDAAMRQLATEGFMHNRTRMVVASFLTKDLYLDWREGAAHFLDLLVDGDIANNNLNWQWTAGTGADTNPHRIFNPTLQGQRFDANGTYIRRYLPELTDAEDLHNPLPLERSLARYPLPIVDHHEAIARYRARQ